MTAAPPITIRPVRGADLLRIAEIESNAFADPWPVALLAIELVHPQAILLAASRDRGPAAGPAGGYIAIRHAAGEAEILRVAVAPAERRQGLARTLVEAGLARLRQEGVEVCHLEVRVDNLGAIALYESLGFAQTGRRRGYYRNGTDALLYAKSL
jgi:ribosomal-protein-alanine acetyltransferase